MEIDTRISPYLGSHQQIYFNLDTPALQKLEVRRAIAQAIDVNAFAKTVWYGYGTLSASPIGKGISRYHDASIQPYPFNPKEAEAALDAAGFKRGAGGTRLKLRVLYNPFQERRAADFVRQSLGRIGIDAAVESYDYATYVTKGLYRTRVRHHAGEPDELVRSHGGRAARLLVKELQGRPALSNSARDNYVDWAAEQDPRRSQRSGEGSGG